jgi:hypothetical protein
MAKNAIDQDLSDAYERHGGPLKAWKHFGKSRGKQAIGKGKDMINYFREKINKMKEGRNPAKKEEGKEMAKKMPMKPRLKKEGTNERIMEKMKTRQPKKMENSAPLKRVSPPKMYISRRLGEGPASRRGSRRSKVGK